MTLFQVSYLLLWALAAALVPTSIVLVYLLARLEEQFKREGSGFGNNLIGRTLPRISAVEASAGVMRGMSDFDGRVHVVLALSPGCGTCGRLIKELTSARSCDLGNVNLLILCIGETERCMAAVSGVHSVPVYVLDTRDDSTMDLWLVGFPAALVVDESGVILDVRHPLSVKGVIAALNGASAIERYPMSRQEVAAP